MIPSGVILIVSFNSASANGVNFFVFNFFFFSFQNFRTATDILPNNLTAEVCHQLIRNFHDSPFSHADSFFVLRCFMWTFMGFCPFSWTDFLSGIHCNHISFEQYFSPAFIAISCYSKITYHLRQPPRVRVRSNRNTPKYHPTEILALLDGIVRNSFSNSQQVTNHC